jgi:hypothetical protein
VVAAEMMPALPIVAACCLLLAPSEPAATTPWIRDPLTLIEHARTAGGPVGSSAGNHRAEVIVSDAEASEAAVAVNVVWRRRASPSAGTQVLAAFENGTLFTELAVANVSAHSALLAFSPVFGTGTYHFYYLPYDFSGGDGRYHSVFSTRSVACAAPPLAGPPPPPTQWRRRNGTAKDSIVVADSGSYCAENAAWKAVDGVYTFLTKTPQSACAQAPLCQGWSSRGGTDEWLIFDMGGCVTIDAVAILAAGDGQHDPKTMWVEVGDSISDLAIVGSHIPIFNFTGNASTHYRQEWSFAPVASRYWKWVTSCRWSNTPCPGFQTYLAEIEWKISAPTPEEGVGGAWRHAHQLDGSPSSVAAAAARLPVLSGAVNFTARTEWDAFTEMEV